MSLRLSASGSAHLDAVWQRYVEPARWPGWAPQIRRVDYADTELTPGSRGRVVGPLGISIPFEIVEVDELKRRWSWRVGYGPARIAMTHGVEPVGGGSEAWVEIHVPAPLALPYAPVARPALRRLVQTENRLDGYPSG